MHSISMKDIYFQFRGKDPLLKNIQLDITQDDFILLNGSNGAGKTTLISLLLGFYKLQKGSIAFSDPLIQNKISYLPQHSSFFAIPMKAIDVVISSFTHSKSFFWSGYQAQKEKAFRTLEDLQIGHLAYQDFSSLSGGQAQKVLLARVFCNPGEFIFLDEPFSNMDKVSRQSMIEKVYNLKGKAGILMISHDMDLIADHKGKFAYLSQGELAVYHNIQEMENSFFHAHNHQDCQLKRI